MPVARSRAAMIDALGAKQRNTVWSWCAVNDVERKVYFSVWLHTHSKRDGVRPSYIIQEPWWGIDKETGARSPARNDHDEKLALVFEHAMRHSATSSRPRTRRRSPRRSRRP